MPFFILPRIFLSYWLKLSSGVTFQWSAWKKFTNLKMCLKSASTSISLLRFWKWILQGSRKEVTNQIFRQMINRLRTDAFSLLWIPPKGALFSLKRMYSISEKKLEHTYEFDWHSKNQYSCLVNNKDLEFWPLTCNINVMLSITISIVSTTNCWFSSDKINLHKNYHKYPKCNSLNSSF